MNSIPAEHNVGARASAPVHAWAFEAGSIQGYILETGRLADAVGASLLVDRLTGDLGDDQRECNDLLSVVLRTVGLGQSDITFSRRGGGAFIAFFGNLELLRRTRLLWQAALHANAPGLRWADGVASDAQQPGAEKRAAQGALRACQQASRMDQARLPEAGPLVLRVARTGQPAAARVRLGKKGLEAVDAATLARRLHSTTRAGLRVLTERFSNEPDLVWPRNMEAADEDQVDGAGCGDSAMGAALRFPFVDGDHEVAFLHADGNGLGVLLQRLQREAKDDEYVAKYAVFSEAVSGATREAAAFATETVLRGQARRNAKGAALTMPARPLVLGGDDLSLIIRADLALPFAVAFMQKFEELSARKLTVMAMGRNWGKLTSACGIAFVKSSFPFTEAHRLAEHLCREAKSAIKAEAAAADAVKAGKAEALIAKARAKAADARASANTASASAVNAKDKKKAAKLELTANNLEVEARKQEKNAEHLPQTMPHSALSLRRVTTSQIEEDRPAVELPGKLYSLGHLSYVLADAPNTQLPRWSDLEALGQLLAGDTSPRGPTRRLLTDLYEDPAMARERYRKWRSERRKDPSVKATPAGRSKLDDIDDLLAKLGLPPGHELPLGDAGTPWPDALLVAELDQQYLARKPAPEETSSTPEEAGP